MNALHILHSLYMEIIKRTVKIKHFIYICSFILSFEKKYFKILFLFYEYDVIVKVMLLSSLKLCIILRIIF